MKMIATLQGLVASTLLSFALGQTNITSSSCVEPSAYDSCNANVVTNGNNCVDACNGSSSCIVSCGCTVHQQYINCMAETCWNQVYSCDYQIFVEQYFSVCPDAVTPIPFWPPPSNAPGGCSCNLGQVYEYVRRAEQEQSTCLINASNSLTSTNGAEVARKESGCSCCGVSAILSAFHDICPNTVIPSTYDFYNIWPFSTTNGLPDLPSLPDGLPVPVPEINISSPDWSVCDTPLKNYNCMKDLGFSGPTNSSNTFYRPDDMPKNGTQTVHYTGSTLTAPPSGTVFSWHQSTATYTVTASGYIRANNNNDNNNDGTGTSSGATQTGSSTSGAGRVSRSIGRVVVGFGFVWLLL